MSQQTFSAGIFVEHEIVLPVAWGNNTVDVPINITVNGTITSAKLRIKIHDVGVYRFGYRMSQTGAAKDLLLGFTIKINGRDVWVMHPIDVTDWITQDVTLYINAGSNVISGAIWRSAINLVVSYYVVVSCYLDVTIENPSGTPNATITVQPPTSSIPSYIFSWDKIIGLLTSIPNIIISIVILYVVIQILPLIMNILKGLEMKRKSRKEEE
jgi:hypothetical protein